MNIDDLNESKFLTKKDCGRGILVTLVKLEQQNVARPNDHPDMKMVAFFQEQEKGFVLGARCNREMMAQIVGSPETDHWIGKQFVLYDEPNVTHMGKLVGGIRVRAPRIPQQQQNPNAHGFGLKQSSGQGAQPAARTVTPPPVEEDDVPF